MSKNEETDDVLRPKAQTRGRRELSGIQATRVDEDAPFLEPLTDETRPPFPGRNLPVQGVWAALHEFTGCVYAYGVLFVTIVFTAILYTFRDNDVPLGPSKPVLQSARYDYIVIGGGPAGSVLAKRLSDDPQHKVLLLEAGGASQHALGGTQYAVEPLTIFDIPIFWSSIAHRRDFHWESDAMIAKALGGCGVHNAMLYVRALPEDFQKWNVTNFSWETMLKEYIKLENYVGPEDHSGIHGKGGPFTTTPPLFVDEVAPYFIEACREYGLPVVKDFNHPGKRIAASYYHFNIRNGQRQSAARTFLGPLLGNRENLEIVLHAEVERILLSMPEEPSEVREGAAGDIASKSSKQRRSADGASHGGRRDDTSHEQVPQSDGSNTRKKTHKKEEVEGRVPKAKAVEFRRNGRLHRASLYPEGEAIVTAGAVNTPKVLMNSGIGDRHRLHSAGIQAVKDLPGVGRNLMDHPGLAMTFELTPELAQKVTSTFTSYGMEELNLYKDWIMSEGASITDDIPRVGDFPIGPQKPYRIFASAGLTAGAFINTGEGSLFDEDLPDIQYTLFPRVSEPHIVAQVTNRTTNELAPPNQMLLTLALLQPQARYSIELRPGDPIRGMPVLQQIAANDSGQFLSRTDVRKLVQGMRLARILFKIDPLEKAVQQEMGPATDPLAVVDERMRVHGVEGVRVGDASTFPHIPNGGNVHSTVVVVASRGAELALEDRQSLDRRRFFPE